MFHECISLVWGWDSVKEKTPEKMVLMLSLAVEQVLRGVEGTLYTAAL